MADCLSAIKAGMFRSVRKAAYFMLPPLLILISTPSHAQTEDSAQAGSCPQAWPVSCEAGGGGGTGCGGWNVLKDLAEPEGFPRILANSSPDLRHQIPEDFPSRCSTGVRIALGNANQTQGQPVGSMFDGFVVFSQDGRSRDGRDYGGVVIIKLDLQDGSPQCYLRYMFLDRRDLVQIGTEVKAGQRIGSVASNDMDATDYNGDGRPEYDWWNRNWPNTVQNGNWGRPQLKIDIGCDEALTNLPHFMPKEPYTGGGPDDPESCPLTKIRFPARPLEYLVNTESGNNPNCDVGIRKDARPQVNEELQAHNRDISEKNLRIDSFWVEGVKPRGALKRKTTPVFALYNNPTIRQTLYDANPKRGAGTMVFRDHQNYRNATALHCKNLGDLFDGRDGDIEEELEPEEIRELFAHCANQHILGRAMFPKVLEYHTALKVDDAEETALLRNNQLLSPIKPHMEQFLHPLEQLYYQELLDGEMEDGSPHPQYPTGVTRKELIDEAMPLIRKVAWRDQCQPLKMIPPTRDDYIVTDILHKSWKELLIDWPEDNDLQPINREPIPHVTSEEYAQFPYERIIDPANPFSPRHIWAETERERYSNYNLQCAPTPVDIILGAYWDEDDKDSRNGQHVYGLRDTKFHQCTACRIELNENRESCIADPYSFQNPGGCQQLTGSITSGGCDDMDPRLRLILEDVAGRYGISPDFMLAIVKRESGCGSGGIGPCNHQHDPGPMGCGIRCENPGSRGHAMSMWQLDVGCNQSRLVHPPCSIPDPHTEMLLDMGNGVFNACDHVEAAENAATLMANLANTYSCDTHAVAGWYNGSGPSGEYAAAIYADFPQDNMCQGGGPFPDGSGTGSGLPPGDGGGTGGTGGPWGGGPFNGGGVGGSVQIGNFNSDGCPGNFFTSAELSPADAAAHNVFAVDGDKGCSAYSYPLPDVLPGGISTSQTYSQWYVNWGCWRWWGGTASSLTYDMCDMMAPEWNNSRWCPYGNCGYGCEGSDCRMHEGVDLMADYGTPIYASAPGVVASTGSMQIAIDHSGECMDPPACTKTFPQGSVTAYLHSGPERQMVNTGQRVERCQQIATVGDAGSPGTPHLHYETHDQSNTVTAPSLGGWNPAGSYPETYLWRSYWPFDTQQRIFAHPTDVSCSGGVWDASGVLGPQGICQWMLPVEPSGKTDLTPPSYLTDADTYLTTGAESRFTPVEMPQESSYERNDIADNEHDPYDREVPGMVYDGVWISCDNSFLSADNRAFCHELADISGSQTNPTPPVTGGATGYMNPAPCHVTTSPYGPRTCSVCASDFHHGVDIGTPEGTPLFAAADGVVEEVDATWTGTCGGRDDLAGVWVRLRHADGSSTRYLHMAEGGICPEVTIGSTVLQGQVIGYSDTTTASCQAHLHFEINIGGQTVDPEEHIPPPSPDDAQCPAAMALQCGDIITGVPIGNGIGGKTLCIDKPCTVNYAQADTVGACAWPKDQGGCGPFGGNVQRAGGGAIPGDCCFNITQPVVGANTLKIRPGFDNEVRGPMWYPGGAENRTFPRATNENSDGIPQGIEHRLWNGEYESAAVLDENKANFLDGAWRGERLGGGGGTSPDGPVSDQRYQEGGEASFGSTDPVTGLDNRGAPQGYTFHEFFHKHRPYMRWWDTGVGSNQLYQNQVDTTILAGWYDTLVGVGVEKNNCGYGGNNNNDIDDDQNANTRWMELKLYQARAQYEHGLSCIARYETKFKRNSAEEAVLRAAGGTFQSSFHGIGSLGQVNIEYPLGWRGFVSEPEPGNSGAWWVFPYVQNYPNYPGGYNSPPNNAYIIGMDNALPGDILVWDHDVVGYSRLPHVAFVTRAHTPAVEAAGGDRYNKMTNKYWLERDVQSTMVYNVTVVDMNYGKYPDACGNTNWLGVGGERKVFKDLAANAEAALGEHGVDQSTCANPDLAICGENYWDDVKVYRPWRHVRY